MSKSKSKNIFWAVVRDLKGRKGYFELTRTGGRRWAVNIDDEEFYVTTDSTDYWDVLAEAIAQRPSKAN